MRHACLAPGLSCLFALGFWSAAGAATLEHGPYSADRVAVDAFSGALTVEVGSSSDVTLKLEGLEEDIKAIDVSEQGRQLIVRGPERSASTSVTVGGRTTVIITNGGRVEVIVGDVSTKDQAENTVSLHVTAPAGTALAVTRFIGAATIGDIEAPLRFELLGGKVHAGRVGAANLKVRGAGDIRVAEAGGDLAMDIKGSGSITVESGTVADLVGEIQGSGALRFGGRAATARLSINGSGSVDVAQVEKEPRSRINGSGTITVGNWR